MKTIMNEQINSNINRELHRMEQMTKIMKNGKTINYAGLTRVENGF
jgi:hypothetical protein